MGADYAVHATPLGELVSLHFVPLEYGNWHRGRREVAQTKKNRPPRANA